MTNEEIKKGLEKCLGVSCDGCPYDDNYTACPSRLKDDARSLIIEQESEIERLKADYAKLQEQFAQYQMASDKEIVAQVKQAKIDVLNELKKYSYCDNDFMDGKWHRYVFVDDIDKLLEDMNNGEDKDGEDKC
nr:MAG TPA: hypothetical protein [Caudoviricetes sp.]